MALVINTNATAINSQRQLANNTTSLSKTMERLASGYRINRSSDDAAGLQISENLRAQIRGSRKALDNVQDAVNVLNITDGSLQTMTNILQRMRELSVQAANDTLNTAQRSAVQIEIDQQVLEITRISDSTQFNGVQLLDGTAPANFNIQLGPNAAASSRLNLSSSSLFNTMNAAALSLTGTQVAVDNASNANGALSNITAAINLVNTRRGSIGAVTNRLQSAEQNLMSSIENLSASESRIRNADVAYESSELVRFQILQQASSTVLSQANQTPQLALSLIGGR